ncbi:MAG: NCS2 family permease [Treponema sp.]|nr:NCS2 family permease [Treponema sp.]
MEKAFNLKAYGTTIQREIVAGFTTFLTMAYILAVNPAMLGSIGNGMTPEAVFTATIIASVVAMLIMAFAANMPIALAPGMGLNAFFTFTVVGGMGYSWQLALTAVFLEGIVFVLLSAFKVRESIINAIPVNLKKAVAVGIGFFIALIGFTNAGIVVRNTGTIIGLGDVTSGEALLALLGFIIIMVLYTLKVPGSILIGILVTTILGIPFGVTIVPENWSPLGTPAAPLLFAFDFAPESVLTYKFFTVFFTFLFVDIFDTVGTLVGVTTQAGLVTRDGKIPHAREALLADAIGTIAGAAVGTSTVTSYVESSAGVAAGGRTGLTTLTTAILFLAALFLAPLFLLIPSAATAPALIMVGYLMLKPVTTINFIEPTEGIPAFLTIVMMPFGYSIAEGIIYGIISYVILKLAANRFGDISGVTWIIFIIFLLRFIL